MRHYAGRVAALATMHGKERAVAPPLLSRLGLALTVPAGLDTDRLGTFTGEVERPFPPRETALAKARLGMEAAGLPLGLASEGSYGPHPQLPFLAWGRELLAFVDGERGLEIVEAAASVRTNFSHLVARPGDPLDGFLSRARFPGHALIVRPNRGEGPIAKGLRDPVAVRQAIARAAEASADGAARIETDMRTHMNPLRLALVRRAARRLALRLATPCPACGAPGWGRMEALPGLPCADCGESTLELRGERHGCAACGASEERPRPDGRTRADPGSCPECNP